MKKAIALLFLVSSFGWASGVYNPTTLTSTTLPSGSTQYINNTSSLKAGSTFYVSSGTVSGPLAVSTLTLVSSATFTGATITNIKTGNAGTSACVGCIGEIISAQKLRSNETGISSGVGANIASITLSPGQWYLTGQIGNDTDGTSKFTIFNNSISTISATAPLANTIGVPDANYQLSIIYNTPSAGLVPVADIFIGQLLENVSVISSTTFYLVVKNTFTLGSAFAYGSLFAVRVQ